MIDKEEGSTDFKPFFDMIVGVLFILLILVAAQIFFTQQSQDSAEQQAAAQQRRALIALEAGNFLDDMATRLKTAGFDPAIDRLNRTISVPVHQLMQRAGSPSTPAFDRDAIRKLADVAHETLSCVSLGVEQARTCRSFGPLKLSSVAPRLSLEQTVAGATPEPASRIAALELATALFASRPGLLQLAAPGGTPAFRTAVEVSSVAKASSDGGQQPAGRFDLLFLFADMGP